MRRLRLLIDRDLRDRFGAEICWAWRTLLTGIGRFWEEGVPGVRACDVAYVSDPSTAPEARIIIKADARRWGNRKTIRLEKVINGERVPSLSFHGEENKPVDIISSGGRLICERDLIFDFFWLVTGQSETHWVKDKHGFFDLSGNDSYRDGVLKKAAASSIGCWLEKILEDLVPTEYLPRWPDGKRFACALSHDVDYPVARRFLEPIRLLARYGSSELSAGIDILRGVKNYWNIPLWVEEEKKRDVRSAFYFSAMKGSPIKYLLGRPDPFYDVRDERFRKLFGYLADHGFEIGLHASYGAYERADQFAHEKRVLEEASRQAIVGNRHHYWHLQPSDPEATLLMHERIGFKYDTSLAHERYLGFRRGISWPFFPYHQAERRELRTLQLSTAWMDEHLFGWKRDNPGDPRELLGQLLETVIGQGGCMTLDVHDYMYDENVFPGRLRLYRWLIDHLSGRADCWMGKPADIAEHWTGRYREMVGRSVGLDKGHATG